MLLLRKELGITTVVETGAFRGDTAACAPLHFERTVTYERSERLYEDARRLRASGVNIEFPLRDSRSDLRELVPSLERPAMLWLDSHWSGDVTYGRDDECPLLVELVEIRLGRGQGNDRSALEPGHERLRDR